MRKEVTQEELDNFLDKVLKYNPKKNKKNKDSEVDKSKKEENEQEEHQSCNSEI